MRAAEHTGAMLTGWRLAQVGRADLAVRRRSGAMLWQCDLALEDLPLGWARAENAHGAEIYIRPARGHDWPLLFLDDVQTSPALEAAARWGGLAIQTSPVGGCHLWLPCTRPMDEQARSRAQRCLAEMIGADRGSVSGEHLGRLAGFKNWKRGGCWVNVLACPPSPRGALHGLELPPDFGTPPFRPRGAPIVKTAVHAGGGDASPSGREWAWVCRMLEAGRNPEAICEELTAKAWLRRGPDAQRYAQRTVETAMAKVGRIVR